MNIDTGTLYQGEQAIQEAKAREERLVEVRYPEYYGKRIPLREVRKQLESLRQQVLNTEIHVVTPE